MNTGPTTRGQSNNRIEPKDRRQVSLMHVFRSARASGDANKDEANYTDGARELTSRSQERRTGTDEATLRQHLTIDLASLMNTINLDAVLPLDDTPYVAKSVINFGFGDMSEMSDSIHAGQQIAQLIRDTLIEHEPRLIPETIEIQMNRDEDAATQRLSFDVSAEMVSTPVDVPLDFVAEVDMGAGKIQMTKLRVQT